MVVKPIAVSWSRRRFVQGLACGLIAGGGIRRSARAEALAALSGSEFDLTIGAAQVGVTGRPRAATLVNGSLPAPLLRWREGDVVTMRVHNALPVPTSIHWHGMIVPADMDGV